MDKSPPQKSGHLPSPGEGKRGVDGYLGYPLRQAANAYQNRLARSLADLGITQPQFSVLTMIAAYPGVSGADIARLALLTPQTVSVIVANLEKAGSLVRRPDDVHGRIIHLDLTTKGRADLDEARRRAHLIEHELVNGLSPDSNRAVRGWLAAVARSLAFPEK